MATQDCKEATVDFIISEGDPEMEAVADDIATNLAKIGITLNVRSLNDTEYDEAELNGDYNILFTRTWGAPYDPHSYFDSWAVPAHVEYSAIGNLEPPLTNATLLDKIAKVQQELDPQVIQAKWKEILNDVHQQAVFMPLWGTRSPFVVSRRLTGFSPGPQAYTLPLTSVQVVEGSSTVTLSPGVGSLFGTVGPLNPHQYGPNALYAQAWIYEGLVGYGQGGEVVPALATSWKTESNGDGQRVTFQLRENVKFHDGSNWNCSVARLNLDHVLSDTVRQRHQWFGAGKYLSNWECSDSGELVLETSTAFYPLLQELSYIRPLVFASAEAFHNGLDSDADEHNSCEPGGFGAAKWDFLEETITCKGLTDPIGTGPFKYVSRDAHPEEEGKDAKVVFARHDDYWGQKTGIEQLELVHYPDQKAVEEALLSEELDMALGVGPLSAQQVQEIKFYHSDKFDVRHSEVTQHALLVMNTQKSPTDDISVRRSVIHGIDKSTFLEEEFAGLEQAVTQLLPLTAPYCNVDLNPKWSYDPEKARLLNCPAPVESSGISTGAIVGIVAACVVAVGSLVFAMHLIDKEKQGKPVFAPEIEVVEKAEPA
ncbi:Extracellular solute-binding protein, family 5 [Seminavis robusta]|uniref:Extracellular solute-binding protein, family 5 n=1 Tax=Seminavis robusta TaxID=568900 RepID=A0A9N8HC45_9STRA|nr:Extracellular solute-binding protein, family 5 [Seminavis robusta]|eukprot:Sro304_g112590.1 Extracellular solute-binding protein, family 5 (596) ;mRNA; r:38312-40226